MLKRLFDIFFSLFGLIFLFPFFLLIAVFIVLDSKGGIFFRQKRVGRNNSDFLLYKFRTMRNNAELLGQLTVGNKDKRITNAGFFLRKHKFDELPQLINVLIGNMSFVGPRPEVRKYVEWYTTEQKQVLSVKPGITDYASIKYSNENELLAKAENPEKFYIENIMPEKLSLNKKYIEDVNLFTDLKIIFLTVFRVFASAFQQPCDKRNGL